MVTIEHYTALESINVDLQGVTGSHFCHLFQSLAKLPKVCFEIEVSFDYMLLQCTLFQLKCLELYGVYFDGFGKWVNENKFGCEIKKSIKNFPRNLKAKIKPSKSSNPQSTFTKFFQNNQHKMGILLINVTAKF